MRAQMSGDYSVATDATGGTVTHVETHRGGASVTIAASRGSFRRSAAAAAPPSAGAAAPFADDAPPDQHRRGAPYGGDSTAPDGYFVPLGNPRNVFERRQVPLCYTPAFFSPAVFGTGRAKCEPRRGLPIEGRRVGGST